MTNDAGTRGPKKAKWPWIATGVVITLLVILGIWLLTQNPGTPGPSPTATAATPTAAVSASSSPSPTTGRSPSPSASSPSPAQSADSPQPAETVPIDEPADIEPELTVRVTKLEAVDGEAEGPGEVAGPAVRFTVSITNETGKTIDLSSTVVNAYYGPDQTPASPLSGPGASQFSSSLADGKSDSGAFVFAIPEEERDQVQVTVDYSVDSPIVAFEGSTP